MLFGVSCEYRTKSNSAQRRQSNTTHPLFPAYFPFSSGPLHKCILYPRDKVWDACAAFCLAAADTFHPMYPSTGPSSGHRPCYTELSWWGSKFWISIVAWPSRYNRRNRGVPRRMVDLCPTTERQRQMSVRRAPALAEAQPGGTPGPATGGSWPRMSSANRIGSCICKKG